MKITFELLVNARESLKRLSELNLPMKTAVKLSRRMARVNEEMKRLGELEFKVASSHGAIPTPDGKGFQLPNLKPEASEEEKNEYMEKANAFLSDIKELHATEVEGFDFPPIPLSELKDIWLRPGELTPSLWLFDDKDLGETDGALS